MSQETLESPDVFNRQLLDALANADNGILKNASESSSRMVRRRIRENGFGRLILPFKPATDADLARLPDTELPVIIEEMEPESVGAKAISFNDSADTAFYRGDKFVVYFAKIPILSWDHPRSDLADDSEGTAFTAAWSAGMSKCV